MTERQPIEWSELSLLEKAAIKKKSESSFLNFTRIWFEVNQSEILRVNWHHKWMAHGAENLIDGKIPERNLVINVPPGGTKTEFFSIHMPGYLHVRSDIKKFRNLNISFSDSLVKRNSRRTRDLISSPEFQELWPCSFGVNQAEEWDIINEKGKVIGQTVSRASGGQITGGRGGFMGPEFSGMVNMDDFNKPDDMFSATKRDTDNRKLVNTVRSRRGDKSIAHPTPFFLIQQRLHVNDATGFVMGGGMGVKFHQIVIPALIDHDYLDSLPEPFREMCWECIKDSPSVIRGGVEYWSYWPEMESVHDLIELWERDEYTFLSQYMQNPKALSGGLINTDWFPRYTVLPQLDWLAVYVDTNSGKVEDHNDYTVLTLAGCVGNSCYIIDVERGRWDPEDLLKKAVEVWDKWKKYTISRPITLRYMAIEDKQAGQGLITTLKKRRNIPVKEIPRGPNQNKLIRCNNVSPEIKTGNVYIPALYDESGAPVHYVKYHDNEIAGPTNWVLPALKEVADFSADDSHENDDILDTIMDAIDDMCIGSALGGGLFG